MSGPRRPARPCPPRRTRMPALAAFGLAAILAVGGCGRQDEASPMPGMTAEEHARMQAGGPAGPEAEGPAGRAPVHLTPEEERALGVVYLRVERAPLRHTVRTVGRIEAPEPGLGTVTPKIEGYVERLYVDQTGVTVRRGQPLLELYSPMLVAAQEELLTAHRLAARVDPSAEEAYARAQELVEAARRRLRYWDITPEQIDRIERRGATTKTLTLVAPFDGVVLEKNVVEGQQVTPGMPLYRMADLSTVWVQGDVFEQDVPYVRVGTPVAIEVAAYPGERWRGRVSFVYPTVDERTRTNRVRVEVPNPDLRLKPGMYATAILEAEVGGDLPVVPLEAVVLTGERNLVFVRDADGRLVPREVVLGLRAGGRVQVRAGLAEGEVIAGSANFLVDAESRLARGSAAAGHAGHGATPAPAAEGHVHD